MERPTLSLGRWLAATLAVTAPAGAVIAGGMAAGVVVPVYGVLGYGAVFALTLPMLRPWLADIVAVNGWARSLAHGIDAEPPLPRREPLGDTVGAIAQVRRAWQQDRATLAASARWHETLFDNLPDPLVLIGQGRRVIRLNNAARAAFGRDITGRDLAAILRDPDVLEAADAVLSGEAGRETEFTLPVPVERTFIARVERLDGTAAEGTTAILALHDITTVRRLEQMRADFVANASHELRTPLSTLVGFIETLRGPARDDAPAREQFLGIMHDQASRMARLINDLLSLSRIELHEHSAPSDRVDVAELVDKAVMALQPLAAAKKMTLARQVTLRPAAVLGQPDELAQLIQNLLDNALKYGREGTEVEIRVAPADRLPPAAAHLRPGAAMVFAVTDHGEGIPREHLPRLTERFYRVDTARSRTLGGTGLGLAIVKHIINRHRGALTIDSTLGVGSTFSVYLPLAAEN